MMTPELVTAALKMIGVLVLIVGGLIGFNVYSKRFLQGRVGGPGRKSVQVLESAPIGLKKTVTLVKVPGAVLVLGITNDRITLLDRLDGQTEDARTLVQPQSPAPSFKEHLQKLTGSWDSSRSPDALADAAE